MGLAYNPGTGSKSNRGDQFKSNAQLVEAMNDPKYENDPAYRREVMEKLERSNIEF